MGDVSRLWLPGRMTPRSGGDDHAMARWVPCDLMLKSRSWQKGVSSGELQRLVQAWEAQSGS